MSSGPCLVRLMLCLVQEGLDTRTATPVTYFLSSSVCGGSLCTDADLSPLHVKLLHILDSALFNSFLKLLVHLYHT